MDAREVIARAMLDRLVGGEDRDTYQAYVTAYLPTYLESADRILDALATNQLAVVGRDATDAMRNAGAKAYHQMGDVYSNIWRAMFDAISPSPLSTGDRR